MLPPIGTRYITHHEKGFKTILEYAGPNPEKTRGDDAHLVRVISAPPKSYEPGHLIAVEEKWFETHQKFKNKET